MRPATRPSNACRAALVVTTDQSGRSTPGLISTAGSFGAVGSVGMARLSHSNPGYPAQQESLLTSLSNASAASFRPSTVVR